MTDVSFEELRGALACGVTATSTTHVMLPLDPVLYAATYTHTLIVNLQRIALLQGNRRAWTHVNRRRDAGQITRAEYVSFREDWRNRCGS